MSKRYTAYQMRVASSSCEEMGHSMVAAMLRQAADLMEREEREKMYEYSVRYKNGELSCLRDTKPFKDEDVAAADCVCVRREVGGWKEVK